MTKLRVWSIAMLCGASGCSKERPTAPPERAAFLEVKPYEELGCRHADVLEQCDGGWCRIPAGCFVMGSPETEWGRGLVDEEMRKVTFTRGFEMRQHETTQREWEAVGFTNPSTAAEWGKDCIGPDCPVGNLSWYEALAFANALSEQHDPPLEPCYELVSCQGAVGTGMACETANLRAPSSYECEGYRLPTEAEWEYAARGGTRTAFYSGEITPQSDSGTCYPEPNLDPIAWWCMNSTNQTHAVGAKIPNAWGLHDMLGNAMEFVQDGPNDWVQLPTAEVTDPVGQLSSEPTRVMRGGNIVSWTSVLRSSARIAGAAQGVTGPTIGFRLVRTLFE